MADRTSFRRKQTAGAAGRRTTAVCIVAVPPVQQLDVVGPATVFTFANQYAHNGAPQYEVTFVTCGDTLVVPSDSSIPLVAARRLRDGLGAVDTLLVAGGAGARAGADDATVRALRRAAKRARRIGSICTGAFVLAQTGLLEGRRATTHWAFADELHRRYPGVALDPEPIWVHDGVYTSAGISAGIDLALALVEEDRGADVALAVARHLVLYLRRPGGQAQYSATLAAQRAEHPTFREIAVWINEHLRDDLSVPALAERAAMSERSFTRRFQADVGISPARFVQRARLDEVRRMLESSEASVEAIADRCGFRDPDVMRRAFQQAFGIAPRDYRRRFSSRAIAGTAT